MTEPAPDSQEVCDPDCQEDCDPDCQEDCDGPCCAPPKCSANSPDWFCPPWETVNLKVTERFDWISGTWIPVES